MKGTKMTNEEYFENIYRIKNEIQKLDDDFYARTEWSVKETADFKTTRKMLCDELEAAFWNETTQDLDQ